MKNIIHHQILKSLIVGLFMTTTGQAALSQNVDDGNAPQLKTDAHNIVTITGARFTYPLVQKWIDEYNKVKPDVQIVIESRGSTDPTKYDILVEVYEQDKEIRSSREYVYVGRYAVLPVANSKSEFVRTYAEKGLDKELITALFFYNVLREEGSDKKKVPLTVYTRLQKAGAPTVFARHFGFEQKDMKGKAVAGADEHLLKAILRDSTAASYLPLGLIYDRNTKQPVEGLAVLPVDLDGNGRVSNDEKHYGSLPEVIAALEEKQPGELHNLPVEQVHLSIEKGNQNRYAWDFLSWVQANGHNDLHAFGYFLLSPSVSTQPPVNKRTLTGTRK